MNLEQFVTCAVIINQRNLRSGNEVLNSSFPFNVDWKAELKKPSPGPLTEEIDHEFVVCKKNNL